MKVLVFFIFFLSISSLQSEVCHENARVILSPPLQGQQHFMEDDFLSKLFDEFIEIALVNKISFNNEKISHIVFQWDDDSRNLHIIDLFEVSNIFGVKVSDFFEHADNLKDHIAPFGISTEGKMLSPEKKKKILEQVHLHLSGLINNELRKKNVSLDKLAFQKGITPRVLRDIVVGMKLPRLPLLLKILGRMDANIVDFFKFIETGLNPKPVARLFKKVKKPHLRRIGQIEAHTSQLLDKINAQLKDILKDIKTKQDSDIVQQENDIKKRRVLKLSKIFQTARILGMSPSGILKHFENLKLHAELAGIETRTLLDKGEIEELSRLVQKNLVDMFEKTGMEIEELAVATQINERYIKTLLKQQESIPSYSTLEGILQALGSDAIHFFEKLESTENFSVHSVKVPFSLVPQEKNKWHGRPMSERIFKIRKLLLSYSSEFELNSLMVKDVDNKNKHLTQKNLHFKTVYKSSRVANIPLSRLADENFVETLVDPSKARFEYISREETLKAEKLLVHLVLNEMRRQKDIYGLTVTGLAIKSGVFVRQVRSFLLGEFIPYYSTLHQIVEKGLGIPTPHLLENFESKLKSFDHIPFASKEILSELEGLYLSKRVKTNLEWVGKRIKQAKEFLKASKIPVKKSLASKGIKSVYVYGQMQMVISFSHLFGISLKDFLGTRDFSEMVKPHRIVFTHLSEERILQEVSIIKKNVEKRRLILNISTRDLKIKLGAVTENNMKTLFNESSTFFPLHRYFQLAEILTREGEDDLFLLDGVNL